jgi:hypothetical protein
MTYQETLKLLDAGFTKDEILAMSTAPAGDPAPAAAPAQAENKPAATLKPAAAPAEQPGQNAMQTAAKPATAPAPAEAQPAPAAASEQSDAQRILAALGKLAEGVAVPPENSVSFEQRLANSILAGMGIKSKED